MTATRPSDASAPAPPSTPASPAVLDPAHPPPGAKVLNGIVIPALEPGEDAVPAQEQALRQWALTPHMMSREQTVALMCQLRKVAGFDPFYRRYLAVLGQIVGDPKCP